MSSVMRPDDWQLSQRQIDAAVAMDLLWGEDNKEGMLKAYWSLLHSPAAQKRLAEWEASWREEDGPILDETRKLLLPGLLRVEQLYAEMPRQWEGIFERQYPKVNPERFVENRYTGLGQLRASGAPIVRDNAPGQRYVYNFDKQEIALGTGIERSLIDDGLFQTNFAVLALGLANSLHQSEEILHANVFNVGMIYHASITGDGCPLFYGKHPIDPGTYSNVRDYPLSEAAIEAVIEDIAMLPDQAGLRVNARPDTLVVPTALQMRGARIFEGMRRELWGETPLKAIRVLDYLSDPKAWFLTTSVKGFVSLRWSPFKLDLTIDGSDLLLAATESYAPGCYNPRACVASFPNEVNR